MGKQATKVGLSDSLEVSINPATEDKQDDIIAAVNGIDLTVADDIRIWMNTAKDGTGTDYIPIVDSEGHLQVDILTAPTIAVTGTFWQATQPVSGTFWQATQPVSHTALTELAAAINASRMDINIAADAVGLATSANQQTDALTDTELRAADVKITLDSEAVILGAGTAAIGKLTANPGVDIGDVDVLSLPGIAGDVADDAADSGNPIKMGGKAKANNGTDPGSVAENDRVDFIADLNRRQHVNISHPNYWSASVDYAAAQTNTTVKAAPGAGLKLYITDILVSNGATAGNITLLDGSGGTVKYELYPAVNGGAAHSFITPIALTANTLLAITSTTVTTHSVTVSGFIAP